MEFYFPIEFNELFKLFHLDYTIHQDFFKMFFLQLSLFFILIIHVCIIIYTITMIHNHHYHKITIKLPLKVQLSEINQLNRTF